MMWKTILETITLLMEIVSQSSYFKTFSIVLTKYLETCQNLVATCHIYLINRPRINVLFKTCVWRLGISKMVLLSSFFDCINALWCYWNNCFYECIYCVPFKMRCYLPYGITWLIPSRHSTNPKEHCFLPAVQGEPEISKSNC